MWDTGTVVLTTDAGAGGESSHCRVESCSTTHRTEFSEAELYARMRGISETLGFVHLMREFKSNDWGAMPSY